MDLGGKFQSTLKNVFLCNLFVSNIKELRIVLVLNLTCKKTVPYVFSFTLFKNLILFSCSKVNLNYASFLILLSRCCIFMILFLNLFSILSFLAFCDVMCYRWSIQVCVTFSVRVQLKANESSEIGLVVGHNNFISFMSKMEKKINHFKQK